MTSPLEGLPSELVSADLSAGAARLSVDTQLYPLGAVYAAAYVFLDRCYVLLDKVSEHTVRVTLTPKASGVSEAALRSYIGEFSNELLSAAWRRQIAQENRAVIEMVTSQAISAAMGPPTLDDLAAFDFGDESFEDPLGIAMSWEEKYKKKDSAAKEEKAEDAAPASAQPLASEPAASEPAASEPAASEPAASEPEGKP